MAYPERAATHPITCTCGARATRVLPGNDPERFNIGAILPHSPPDDLANWCQYADLDWMVKK